MKIVSLHIYPIKSLGGIEVASSQLLDRGLAYDRRWVLVDDNGLFLSQRTIPSLALFSVKIDKGLVIVSENGDTICAPLEAEGKPVTVSIWDDVLEGVEVSKKVSTWFSKQLNISTRLVYMPEQTTRLIDKRYAFNQEVVSFADGYPILIGNTASLAQLNAKLASPITMNRFRPNIIVAGNKPFEEDNWAEIRVGSAHIKVVKKCARCVVVNINPATAAKEIEVLQVLATFRKEGHKVLFGANALVILPGIISVGDEVDFTN